MLISQRIAKDPNWLRVAHETKSSKAAVFDLRMKIVKAVKMVVPQELFDVDRPLNDLDKQIFGHTPPKREESQRRLMLYSMFSKLPYPLLFIENHKGGNLLESLPDGSFNIYAVLDTGRCLYFAVNVVVDEEGVAAKTRWIVSEAEVKDKLGNRFDGYLEAKEQLATTSTIAVAELLLYVNTKNVVKHHYQPNKRENAVVPKPLLPHYSYYVLDVFKDRTEYVSLDQITDDLCNPNKSPVARRAGLVMGHFKKRATGLFWWNMYLRNSRNAEKLGVVDKDYQVRLKETNERVPEEPESQPGS